MSWTPMYGKVLSYPYALHTKVINLPMRDSTRDQVIGALNAAKEWYDMALRLDAECRTLTNDNLRLKHENEFMLRQLNEREK